jgi:hypothetical protein
LADASQDVEENDDSLGRKRSAFVLKVVTPTKTHHLDSFYLFFATDSWKNKQFHILSGSPEGCFWDLGCFFTGDCRLSFVMIVFEFCEI